MTIFVYETRAKSITVVVGEARPLALSVWDIAYETRLVGSCSPRPGSLFVPLLLCFVLLTRSGRESKSFWFFSKTHEQRLCELLGGSSHNHRTADVARGLATLLEEFVKHTHDSSA